MLFRLLKLQLQSLFHGLFQKNLQSSRGGGKLLKIFLVLLLLYSAGAGLFTAGMLFESLIPLCEAGFSWLYFGLAGLVAFFLSLFLGLFQASGSLFAAKDNGLLLSMPIPLRLILFSRMACLYLLSVCICALMLLPAGFVYAKNFGMDLWRLFCLLLLTALLPLAVNAFSAAIGYVLDSLGRRFRKKNLFTALFAIGFLGLYFFFYSRIPGYLEALLTNAGDLSEVLREKAFPLYHFGMAIGEGKPQSLILSALLCGLPLLPVCFLLEKGFLTLASAAPGDGGRERKHPLKIRSRKPKRALLFREIRRISSNAMLLLNGAMGLPLLLGFSLFYILKGDSLKALLPLLQIPEAALLCLLLCLCLSTCYLSACSVSLEGREHWILRSLPVETEKILFAKLWAHVLLAAPFLLLSELILLLGAVKGSSDLISALIFPWSYLLLTAAAGLFLNLQFPKLDWTNEVLVAKQSLASLFSMLANLVLLFLFSLLYAKLLRERMRLELYLGILSLLFLLLFAALGQAIRTNGVRHYEEL